MNKFQTEVLQKKINGIFNVFEFEYAKNLYTHDSMSMFDQRDIDQINFSNNYRKKIVDFLKDKNCSFDKMYMIYTTSYIKITFTKLFYNKNNLDKFELIITNTIDSKQNVDFNSEDSIFALIKNQIELDILS